MNKPLYCFLFLYNIVLFLSSCDPTDAKLHIVNKSDKDLYYALSHHYPDTTLKNVISPQATDVYTGKEITRHKGSFRCVEAHSTKYCSTSGRGYWEHIIPNRNKDSIVTIFLFDVEEVHKQPWECVRESYSIVKRYDISLKELQRRNWRVVYPDSLPALNSNEL